MISSVPKGKAGPAPHVTPSHIAHCTCRNCIGIFNKSIDNVIMNHLFVGLEYQLRSKHLLKYKKNVGM